MYRKIINEIQQERSLFKPKNNNILSDTEGLNKAYTNGQGFFIDGNKLYVAGTFGKKKIKSNIDDILSDIGLPLNLTRYSERYKDVSEVLENNMNLDTVISHSLGSAISSEYIKNNPNKEIKHLTTYGAPFVSWSSKNNDSYTNFRSSGDVVSILDRGSIQTRTNTYNPLVNHQYTNFQDQGKEPTVGGDPVRLIM